MDLEDVRRIFADEIMSAKEKGEQSIKRGSYLVGGHQLAVAKTLRELRVKLERLDTVRLEKPAQPSPINKPAGFLGVDRDGNKLVTAVLSASLAYHG